MNGFVCSTCGETHPDLPMCFGPSAPDLWWSIPEAEREARGELSSDQCVVDGQHFFVLGRIELPVLDGPGPFVWLAWVSLSEKSFARTHELWDVEGREAEPAYFGWLSSSLPYAANTLSLKTQVQTMPLGERPSILLEPTEHPLALEQHQGITMARVQQLVEAAMHGQLAP